MAGSTLQMMASEASSHHSVAPVMRSGPGRSGTGCEGGNIITRQRRIRMGNSLKVATWNCGGLSYVQRELCKELSYDILLLTETHDKGALKSTSSYVPAEPAPSNDPYSGVALLLSDNVARCVSFSGSCGSRIVYARIRANPCDLFVIGAYMPHSQRKCKPFPADTLKQLEDIISRVSQHTCIILLGDFNCKLERNISKVTGQWCVHTSCNREGKEFRDMLQRLKLVAISTFFQPQRGKSNATYIAKDPIYKPSQIDYIVVSTRWASSVVDSKVKWGITCQRWGRHYDHGLVCCILRMRVRGRKVSAKKIDYSTLESDAELRSQYNSKVQSCLENRSVDQSDPAESLRVLQESVSEAANAVLPTRRPVKFRKRHISNHTRELYQERERRYQEMSPSERKDATKRIWKASRKDYVDYLDGVLSDMEAAARNGNTREVTRLTKLLSGKTTSSTMPGKDLSSTPISSTEQLLNAWNEFLGKKFAAPESDLNRSLEQLASEEDHLSTSELEKAFKGLKNNRAPGWDDVPIEAYRHSTTAKSELFRVTRLIWDTELIPPMLVRGIFIMLYKKGPKDNFANYRAICLLCHAYKLISALIAQRLHIDLAEILPDSQAGFRPARGTRDNVCILKWTVNMLLRESREAVVTFIDYTAAFDTESQVFLDEALSSAGVSSKVRRMIQSIFTAASGCIRIRNPDRSVETSEPFNISRGVLQGDIFSPVAFIVGLWRTFSLHDIPESGVTVGDPPHQVTVSSLEYADDAALIDDNASKASIRITAIAAGSRQDAAMEISKPKTKALHIHRSYPVSQTTEQEIIALKLKHKCPECERTFPTKRGLSIHRARWCTSGLVIRSRTGSSADRAVQRAKRIQQEAQRPSVSIEGEDIENVHDFTYLGNVTQFDGDEMADVTHRMHIAQARFSSLHHMWQDHRLPTSMKLRLYEAAVCSSLTHSCEAWDLSPSVMKSVNGFNSRCLHMITKKSYHSTATAPDYNLILAMRRRRMRFLGHLMRMDNNRLLKRCFIAYVRGGSSPPTGSLLMDCQNEPLSVLELAAQDRAGWNRRINNLE